MIPPRHTPNSVLAFRARLYRSRHPTLRTVRITGDGGVWVDGVRRACNVIGDSITITAHLTDRSPVKLAMLCGMADAMEPAR